MYIEQDPNLIWKQGARFKASRLFYIIYILHYFFLATLQKCMSGVYIIIIGLWSFLNKQNLWILNQLIVLFTPLIIYTSLCNLKTIYFGNPKWRRSHYGGYMSISFTFL